MNIGVILKQVPPSGDSLKVSPAGVDLSGAKMEINPYDEFALEEALKLKDADGSTVTVFGIGDAELDGRLRDALARGANEAVRLDDAAVHASDNLGKARALAAALKAAGVDLVFTGQLAIDEDDGQLAIMVAELLGWSQLTVVDRLELGGGKAKGWRQAGGGAREVVEVALPAVITTDKGLNEPRYAKLKGIMDAKKKKIAVKTAAELGLGAGALASQVSVGNYAPPAARPAGRLLQGAPAQQVAELVRLLRDEAKVL